MPYVLTAFPCSHSVIDCIDPSIRVADSNLKKNGGPEKGSGQPVVKWGIIVAAMGGRRLQRCCKKTVGWAASLALVYVVLNSLQDVIRYVKISRL